MLPEQTWKELLRLGRTRCYPPGVRMLRQGEPGSFVLALTDGLIKVVRREADGAETPLAFRGPGDLLGEVPLFDGCGLRTADVIALTRCTTTVLDARLFRRFVEERGLLAELMQQTFARLRESDDSRAELLTLPLATRLARTLLRLACLASSPSSPCPPCSSVHAQAPLATPLRLSGLTQEELGRSIGVTRNAAVNGLRQLRACGAVRTERKAIVITDLTELRRWADLG